MLILFALPETLQKEKETEEIGQGLGEGEEVEVATSELAPREPPQLAGSRASTAEIVRQRTTKSIRIMQISFLDPLKVIRFLRFPAILLTVYYASITFGSLYVLNISIQSTFEKAPYNFPTLIVGLLYLPASIGYVISSIGGGRWMDHIMAREARKAGRYDERGGLIYRPEDRMRENAWLGAIFYPLALVVYGWTVQKGVHWVVPVGDYEAD